MKRHHTDLFSLFFGVLFAAIAAWWIFGTTANAARTAGWSAIGLLVILGIVGLVSAANRRDTPSVESGVAAAPTADVTSGGDPFAAAGLATAPVSAAPSSASTSAEAPVPGRHSDTMVLDEGPASDDTAVLPTAEHVEGDHDTAETQPQPRWDGEPEGGIR